MSSSESFSSRLLRRIGLVSFWCLIVMLSAAYAALLPGIFLPRRIILRIVNSYVISVIWLARWTLGIQWSAVGCVAEARHPVLVAAKHQSAFETLILQHVLGDPAIILKRELLSIPIVGLVLRRLGHIGIDRSGDLDAVRRLLAEVRHANKEGRPVLIFPEGSRREIGAHPDYKAGVALLYQALNVPCHPVALNSGRVWSARSLSPQGGQIVIEFLPPIGPGLPRAEFAKRLEDEIEGATRRLLDLPLHGSPL